MPVCTIKQERWAKGVEGKYKEMITVINMEPRLFQEDRKTWVKGGDINTWQVPVGWKNYKNQITRGREGGRKVVVVGEWTPWEWDYGRVTIIGYEELYCLYTEGKWKITLLEKLVIKLPLQESSTWIFKDYEGVMLGRVTVRQELKLSRKEEVLCGLQMTV